MNVVFDLGAVLVRWEPALLLQSHFPRHASSDAEAAALARAMFQHEDWHAFDAGLRSLDEVVSRSAARLGLPEDGLRTLVESIGDRLDPIPENIAALHSLHARREAGEPLRLYYLSNMPVAYARTLERRHAFFACFDGGIFSGDVKRVKPHEEIYELLAWRYGLDPAQTVFFDDTVPNIETARAMGWQAVHIATPTALPVQIERLLRQTA